MATVNGFNKTSQNDLLNTGVDLAPILGRPRQQRIFNAIAMINPAVKAPTWKIPRRDLITVNTALAESDEADYTSFTTDSTSITPSVYPVRAFLTAEFEQDADITVDAMQSSIDAALETILDAMDANVLGQISNATNTTDHNGVALDKSKFEAAHLAFKAQNGDPGQHIFVGGYKQIANIIAAYSNAGGAAYAAPGVVSGAVASDPSSFFRGNVGGIGLFEGKVPASGGSDVSGAFMIREMALALGIWVPLQVTPMQVPGRVGQDLLCWSRYGTGIVRQENIHEVISLA